MEEIENRMVVDSEWLEPEVVLRCDDCGSGIGCEEYYYDIGGDTICEGCIVDYIRMNFRREAK